VGVGRCGGGGVATWGGVSRGGGATREAPFWDGAGRGVRWGGCGWGGWAVGYGVVAVRGL